MNLPALVNERKTIQMPELLNTILAQGTTVHDCDGCSLEDHCRAAQFWCRPFRLLTERLGIGESDNVLEEAPHA